MRDDHSRSSKGASIEVPRRISNFGIFWKDKLKLSNRRINQSPQPSKIANPPSPVQGRKTITQHTRLHMCHTHMHLPTQDIITRYREWCSIRRISRIIRQMAGDTQLTCRANVALPAAVNTCPAHAVSMHPNLRLVLSNLQL